MFTRYQETLTKGTFDKLVESWPNHQTKTIQYKVTKNKCLYYFVIINSTCGWYKQS